MKKRKSRVKRKKGFSRIIIALLIILLLSLILKLSFFAAQKSNLKTASNETRPNLQIETFPFGTAATTTPNPLPTKPGVSIPTVTPTGTTQIPTPTTRPGFCPEGTRHKIDDKSCICAARFFLCNGGFCAFVDEDRSMSRLPLGCPEMNAPGNNKCQPPIALDGDGWYCLGKPVIYLYPEKDMLVDVEIKTPGKIVVSDPLYPKNGWEQVLAHPGGKLEYAGKTYSELFYESNVKDFGKPTTGITLDTKNVKFQLDSVISKLGLIGAEKTEFLDWWVPKLEALNSKYIFFSIIEDAEKEKIDHVSYNPEPDTRIEFIAYFKPLQKKFEGVQLELPTTPPKRVGFTAVEWGGVIDYKN